MKRAARILILFGIVLSVELSFSSAMADPELDQLMQEMDHSAPASKVVYNDAFCKEAKIAVDWVLLEDAGTRSTFTNAIRSGSTTFDAVVFAQHHNRHAQDMIRGCRYSPKYIEEAIGPPPK